MTKKEGTGATKPVIASAARQSRASFTTALDCRVAPLLAMTVNDG
ncbi:hypothetical protein [Parasphingorhabdus halotolerans]|nr:hypothetical protein [Parasphingorhabdus halotolerans]